MHAHTHIHTHMRACTSPRPPPPHTHTQNVCTIFLLHGTCLLVAPLCVFSHCMITIPDLPDCFDPQIVNWYTRGDNGETCYVQWKPVCYLDSHRARDVGTEVTIYDLQEPSKVKSLESLLELSLAKAFFGDTMNESSLVMQMSTNVSFGLSQDGYYLKNNYTVW